MPSPAFTIVPKSTTPEVGVFEEPFTVMLATAPTSVAVYDGLVEALAHEGTVGSVSVNEVRYPASLLNADTFVGTVGIVGLLRICATPLEAFQSELTCAAGITVVSGKAPTSDAARLIFEVSGFPLTVLDVGTAPTSDAVYVGLVSAFAHS